MVCQVSYENSLAGSTVSHFSDWSCIWNFKSRIPFLILIFENQCYYKRRFELRLAEYHSSHAKVFLSAFTQLRPSKLLLINLRTESVNNKVPSKKSGWKVKKIEGIFGKFQMAASIRMLRISASYSTQSLYRIFDWRILGLILENW